jgi:hypothetical protein
MAKSLENQLKDLEKVENPTAEELEKIEVLKEKIAKKNEVKEVKAVESNYIDPDFYSEVVNLAFQKARVKPTEWKKEKELQKLLEQAKEFDGRLPKIDKKENQRTGLKMQTLSYKGATIYLVEGVPAPAQFTDKLGEMQLKQYFK